MNREIKFHGRRVDNGEWSVGHYLTRRTKDQGLQHMISVQDMWGFHEVDPETVGQYTGLKDKNGKEVYEGDILSNGQHINWLVIYEGASFKVEHVGQITDDNWFLTRGMAESREIIGNIYDNSDLLEVSP